ncbi:MAG: hypothetical protein J0H83_09470 [Candidatus Melainabacteria bacterium]|nr:hypothetical protein [Candidatus Melainabacteria bacterium]
MSGHSGGGGGSGSVFDPGDDCESLVLNTHISSPKEDVVDQLKVGDVLDVSVQMQGATSVVVVSHNGQMAGGLAAPQVAKLRECIQKGTRYIATVTEKNAGLTKVRVTAKRQS